ncbi:anti-sigma regulatory factor (Ser/Thr protein kinase) [Jatrophihabitans sp. GAS493]|uniref:ATP-binding protein n=1 Tax=Jatrophihabitans sp. GAS493 TaxID=1907575 RepID=UPI000BB70125|nr:ATP-binding protein [Jatrophihabitans sp. GAS493]SOD71061.1 anti-sigma regulatory factor (Ser/Thr protein kinase) [Jatrophihabitans sp. GAS493]
MFTTWASPDADSVTAVRHGLARNLQMLSLAPEIIDDAELVLGELLVNSIRHARPLDSGRIEVAWDLRDDAVVLRVTDGGGAETPHVRETGTFESGGRGLRIVQALADRWGVIRSDATSTVWAELALGNAAAS